MKLRWSRLMNLRTMMLERSMRKIKLYRMEKEENVCNLIQWQESDIEKRLKKKIKENYDSMEVLFRKEMRICLKKLKSVKQENSKEIKKIGKERKWIRDNSKELIYLLGEELGLKIGIFQKKVKWKKKRMAGMHRKTIWKGVEVMIETKHLPLIEMPKQREGGSRSGLLIENNCSEDGMEKNTTKFNPKVCSLAIQKHGYAVDCKLRSSNELTCYMTNTCLCTMNNSFANLLVNEPSIDASAESRKVKMKQRVRKKNKWKYLSKVEQTMIEYTLTNGEENQRKMLSQVWSNAKRKSGKTVNCMRQSFQKHIVHNIGLECEIKVYNKLWKENSEVRNFPRKRRSRFKNPKPIIIMEIDRFKKFVIDTHSWRSNGFRNLYRWKRSLWDEFGWSGPDRFALWEDLPQEYAVMNRNLDVEEYSIMSCGGNSEVNVYEIPKLNGFWKQSHLCFGMDQKGDLEWHKFKIYCSDEVPENGEFVLWKTVNLIPVLWLDRNRCLFAEEEELRRYNPRRMAIKGNVYLMEEKLM
jgi:hypothetical protein